MEKKHCEKLGAKVSRNSHPPFHSISPNFLLFIPFQRLTRWRLLHVRNLIRPKIGIWKCSFQFPPPRFIVLDEFRSRFSSFGISSALIKISMVLYHFAWFAVYRSPVDTHFPSWAESWYDENLRIPFERFRVYEIKIRIDSKKKKKKRSNPFPLSYEHFYERSLRDASNDSTIKKIVSPIIPKFSPIPTSRDQFTTIKGD